MHKEDHDTTSSGVKADTVNIESISGVFSVDLKETSVFISDKYNKANWLYTQTYVTTTVDSHYVEGEREMPQLVFKELHIANTQGNSFVSS